MKYLITFGELIDRGLWLSYCEKFGINEWAVNEGLASSDDEVVLTEEEAQELGIINVD